MRGAITGPRPSSETHVTTLINILTVDPKNTVQLVELLRENVTKVIQALDGWIATNVLRSADGTRVIIHSQWRDAASVEAMRRDPRMVAYFPRIAALAALDSIVSETAFSLSAWHGRNDA
jgi:quinol monooxygenase YgiN